MKKRPLFLLVFLLVSLVLSINPPIVQAQETFGRTDVGTSDFGVSDDYLMGTKYPLSEDGSVSKITLYIEAIYGNPKKLTCGIYDSSLDFVDGSATVEVSNPSFPGWVDFSIAGGTVDLTAGDYFLVAIWGKNTVIKYDADGANTFSYGANTYADGLPTTIPTPSLSYQMSIYATYTTAGEEENFYGTISQLSSIASTNTWTFNRYATLTQTSPINTMLEYMQTHNLFGTILQALSMGSQRNWLFNRYNVLNPTFSLISTRSWTFNLFPTVNPTFNIVGVSEFITGQILDIAGVIAQTISVASLRAWSLSRFGLVNPSFTINNVADFISTQILNIPGTIAQIFAATSQRSWALIRFGLVNPSVAVESVSTFITNVLNFFGNIGNIFGIGGWTDLPIPEAVTNIALVLAAFAVVLAIIALTLGLSKKRESTTGEIPA